MLHRRQLMDVNLNTCALQFWWKSHQVCMRIWELMLVKGWKKQTINGSGRDIIHNIYTNSSSFTPLCNTSQGKVKKQERNYYSGSKIYHFMFNQIGWMLIKICSQDLMLESIQLRNSFALTLAMTVENEAFTFKISSINMLLALKLTKVENKEGKKTSKSRQRRW